MGALVVLLVHLTVVLSAVRAQGQCEEWRGQPRECVPYVRFHTDPHVRDLHVYVPDQLGSQEALATAFYDAFQPAVNALHAECRKAVTQLTCLTALPACSNQTLTLGNTTISLPRFPCNAVCEGVNAACKGAGIVVNCSVLEPTTGLPWYPQTHTQFAPSLSVPCFADAGVPEKVPVDACPRNFAYAPDEDMCVPRCPDGYTTYSHSQRWVSYVLLLATFVVTLVSNTWIIVPFLLSKSRRVFPHYTPAILSISHTLMWISLVLGTYTSPDDWICKDDVSLRDKSSPMCAIQSVAVIWFIPSTTLWMAAITFNILMLTISQSWLLGRANAWMKVAEVAEHVVCWGGGLFVPVFQLSADRLGLMLPDVGFCAGEDAKDHDIPLIIPFQIVITIGLVSAILFLGAALTRLAYRKYFLHQEWGFQSVAREMWKVCGSPKLACEALIASKALRHMCSLSPPFGTG